MKQIVLYISLLLCGFSVSAQVQKLTTYQYWFDADYSTAQTTTVAATATLSLDEDIDVSALEYGLHTVSFRFKDDRGVWSPPVNRFFTWGASGSGTPELKEIVAYEYWFDADYSTAQTTTVGATTSLTLSEQIDVSSLEHGLHTVSFRFKDERGVWSPPVNRFFTWGNGSGTPELKEIIAYEYWFDADYSTAQTTTVGATATLTLSEQIDVSSLEHGLHTVSFRFKDERGVWSPPINRFFTWGNGSGTPELKEIIAYEYWFDADYSTAQTTTVGATATLTLSEQIDVSSLERGLHTVSYRFKDERGVWSSPISRFFTWGTGSGTPELKEIIAYEYWFDADYSTAQTTTVGATASLTLDEQIDVAPLKRGLHTVSYRFKDERNVWSSPVSKFFTKGIVTAPDMKEVIAYEYWFDTDYSTVQTTTVSPTTSLTLDEDIDVSSLLGGVHTLNYRFKDERGVWSVAVGGQFSKAYAPRATLSADVNPVCIGNSVSLSAETLDVDKIVWDFGDNTATQTLEVTQSPKHTYAQAGNFVVTAHLSHSASTNTGTATMTITVNDVTVPTFTQVAAIGSGDDLAPLPTTSNNGIQGSWSPELDNTQTTEYTFTPDSGQCATSTTMTITVNNIVVPTFTQIAAICEGEALAPLPTTSDNSIEGSWSPALDNTQTTEYTFTPDEGQYATTATMTITVNQKVVPTFTQVAAIPFGGTLSPLPTTSNNGIQGSWSPALDNTQTTEYTFTPNAGECATTATMTITVNDLVVPTFTQVADICEGDALAPLPTTSDNGIQGSWSPALDNTQTTEYTFTPDEGQYAATVTMTITVNQKVVPTFTQVAAIPFGGTLSPLPTTSNNGIEGSWSPALDNTQTTEYTFTPNAGECATTATMTITVNDLVVPTFTQVADICEGDALSPLPTTSDNGIQGSWSPALNNTQTTEYTFTPDEGQYAATATMTITVNQKVVPTFTQVAAICEGEALAPLPTTSENGIQGSWSPALDNTQTKEYTFTPNVGECATTATMTITVNDLVVPTFTQVAAICEGEALAPLPTTSENGIQGSWSPALDNTQTTEYTFTPNVGECATTATMTITVNQKIVPTFTQVAPIRIGDPLAPLPTVSNNGIQGTWSPELNNRWTTQYTFTPTSGDCVATAKMTIVVKRKTVPLFTQVAPICEGETLAPLPTVSDNGIQGSWSPALDNTQTTEYTFTPNSGQYATGAVMTIEVNEKVTPEFTQVAPICKGETLAPLPTVSENGVQGSWSPALDNTQTTEYTFTPNSGECATTATMTITVNDLVVPTFTSVADICEGDALAPLPTTSDNGIQGSWSPALDNTQTTEYTFTPNSGECATTATMTIRVNKKVVPTFTQVSDICEGEELESLPTTSDNGIQGSWSPALDNTQTTEYTFTPNSGECATIATMTVVVSKKSYTTITDSICSTALPYKFGEQSLIKSGVYSETFQSANSCDSIVELRLKVFELEVPKVNILEQPGCGNTVGRIEILNYNSEYHYEVHPKQGVILDGKNIIAPEGEYVLTVTYKNCEESSESFIITEPLEKPVVVTHPIDVRLPEVVDLTQKAVTEGSSEDLTFSYWADPEGTVSLENPSKITESGVYYIKGVNASGCSAIAAIEVVVTRFLPIVTEEDFAKVEFEKSVTVDVATNDTFRAEDGDDDNYSISREPENGSLTEVSDGVFIYTPNEGFVGQDTFYYRLCNIINECQEERVTILVELPKLFKKEKLVVNQLLTPNGDGSNEAWISKDLQVYSLSGIYNKVMLFNRSGRKVYEKENYMIDGKPFIGKGNVGAFNKDKLLPRGVYFYVIIVEGRGEQTGYLYIIY